MIIIRVIILIKLNYERVKMRVVKIKNLIIKNLINIRFIIIRVKIYLKVIENFENKKVKREINLNRKG